jgi:4'-phosphopantetheinyl transferase
MDGVADHAGARLGKIHVWTAWLTDDEDRATTAYFGLLDEGERARAKAFRFAHDRSRFIHSHGILRRILARYTGVDAAALTFQQGAHGKPSLALPGWGSELHFNLSHSANCCLVAIRMGCPVGIDVERRRELPNLMDIACRHFTPSESELIFRRHGAAREEAFFALWTHKEAVVKALGTRLADYLDRLEFDLGQDGDVRLASLDGDSSIGDRWSVVHLEGLSGYVAAVAGTPGFDTVDRFAWSDDAETGEARWQPRQTNSSPESSPSPGSDRTSIMTESPRRYC